ncbi:ATP-binding protein [Corallococcus terminator]
MLEFRPSARSNIRGFDEVASAAFSALRLLTEHLQLFSCSLKCRSFREAWKFHESWVSVTARHGELLQRASTLNTSNRPVEDQGRLLGDTAAVAAMLDRLLHHAHVVQFGPVAGAPRVPRSCELPSPRGKNPPVWVLFLWPVFT